MKKPITFAPLFGNSNISKNFYPWGQSVPSLSSRVQLVPYLNLLQFVVISTGYNL